MLSLRFSIEQCFTQIYIIIKTAVKPLRGSVFARDKRKHARAVPLKLVNGKQRSVAIEVALVALATAGRGVSEQRRRKRGNKIFFLLTYVEPLGQHPELAQQDAFGSVQQPLPEDQEQQVLLCAHVTLKAIIERKKDKNAPPTEKRNVRAAGDKWNLLVIDEIKHKGSKARVEEKAWSGNIKVLGSRERDCRQRKVDLLHGLVHCGLSSMKMFVSMMMYYRRQMLVKETS